jgi:hypothetical protein
MSVAGFFNFGLLGAEASNSGGGRLPNTLVANETPDVAALVGSYLDPPVLFTTPGAGSIVVPAGMNTLVAEAWGGGAGGSGTGTPTGGGGGGGGYSKFQTPVTAGATVYYYVANAGAGSSALAPVGETSWVNAAANAQPSSNGCVAAGGGQNGSGGALGGAGTVGTTNFTGGTAGSSNQGTGGGGGAGSAGNGGNGVNGTHGNGGTPDGGNGVDGIGGNVTTTASQPGGGGGGSYFGTGGAGGNGQVRMVFSFVPPATLTLPTLVTTGSNTATVGATSNSALGTIYFVVTTNSSTPSAAQIIAGQDASGSAAPYATSKPAASGVNTASAVGLLISTTYYGFIVQFSSGNSNVVASSPATTSSTFTPVSFTFTAVGASSFVTPSGATTLVGEAWGGGGGGCGNGSAAGGGGGGGGYSRFTIAVTTGQAIYYNVAAGGTGTNAFGTVGGNSWVNSSANAQPSSNGCVGNGGGINGNGGALGGAGTIGTTNFTGGTGGSGTNGNGGGGGAGSAGNGGNGSGATHGVGGTPDGGAGIDGVGGGTITTPGVQPGGGAGGSWTGTGGPGGLGQVKLSFT